MHKVMMLAKSMMGMTRAKPVVEASPDPWARFCNAVNGAERSPMHLRLVVWRLVLCGNYDI